jgi:hypothetical protein
MVRNLVELLFMLQKTLKTLIINPVNCISKTIFSHPLKKTSAKITFADFNSKFNF